MAYMNELIIVDLDYLTDSSQWFEHFLDETLPCFLDSCSSRYSEPHSRYDIITADPWAVLAVNSKGQVTVRNNQIGERVVNSKQSPFDCLEELLEQMTPVARHSLPFTGGAIGFWGYELASILEPGRIPHRKMKTPLMSVGLYHWALVTDHEQCTTQIVFHPDCSKQQKEKVLGLIDRQSDKQLESFRLTRNFSPTISKNEYKTAFDRVKEYILAGDCYEVNLTQEFVAEFEGNSWPAYKKTAQSQPCAIFCVSAASGF